MILPPNTNAMVITIGPITVTIDPFVVIVLVIALTMMYKLRK